MKLFLLGALTPFIHFHILMPTTPLEGTLLEFNIAAGLSMMLIAFSKQYPAAVAWYLSAAYSNMAIFIMPIIPFGVDDYGRIICVALTAVYLVAAWLHARSGSSIQATMSNGSPIASASAFSFWHLN